MIHKNAVRQQGRHHQVNSSPTLHRWLVIAVCERRPVSLTTWQPVTCGHFVKNSDFAVYLDLERLQELSLIRREGKGRATRYVLKGGS